MAHLPPLQIKLQENSSNLGPGVSADGECKPSKWSQRNLFQHVTACKIAWKIFSSRISLPRCFSYTGKHGPIRRRWDAVQMDLTWWYIHPTKRELSGGYGSIHVVIDSQLSNIGHSMGYNNILPTWLVSSVNTEVQGVKANYFDESPVSLRKSLT